MKPKPQPYMREVVLDVPPVMQLDLYAHTVIVTRRGANGRWTSYPIRPQALAEVLGNSPASSGILPANTLAYSSCSGVARYVVYRPAGRAVIRAAFAGVERRLDIPTPPLVWEGQRTDYRLWALDTRLYPVQPENTPLYNAPFPNLYPGGGICWGDSDSRRVAAPDAMAAMLDLFLTGWRFSGHLAGNKSRMHGANVLGLLAELDGAETFPLHDLLASGMTLADVIGNERGKR